MTSLASAPADPARGRVQRLAQAALYWATVVTLFAAGAEGTARAQDWFVEGTPLAASPKMDRDLFMDSESGRRGRPHGRYRKWELNEYGFRAGPMVMRPSQDRPRLLILGSSETFGIYESPGREFPAVLSARLRSRYEVVNAAIPGATVASLVAYWREWVSRFDPAIVLIYPSPLFYLNGDPQPDLNLAPATPRPRDLGTARKSHAWLQQRSVGETVLSLRLAQRAQDQLEVPDVIQRWRDQRAIRAAVSNHPADWVFQRAPISRADVFVRHLETLVRDVRRSGARAIVMTHASRVTDPPRPQDMDWLERARVNTPRASATSIAQFETLTNVMLREWAFRNDVEVIDVHARLAGREELFGDLIHFNDAGASAVAAAIVLHLDQQDASPRQVVTGSMLDAVQ